MALFLTRIAKHMARPIWTGTLSFGLLNVPVSLMAGERSTDLKFRMLDSRDKKPIRFERVNADTGEEVPWKEIIKAFEYDKGSYVVVDQDDIKSAAPESHESIDVEAFVDVNDIDVRYFEKPYILAPGKKAEKGYVLLRDTLKSTGKIGVARVVIRTREYLSAVMPVGDALILVLMRYPQELVDPADYALPDEAASKYRISDKEMDMARQLIESMSAKWNPSDYKDEFRERLSAIIKKRIKDKGGIAKVEEPAIREDAATNVVDFMSLLEKSLKEKGGGKPAAKAKAPAKAAAKTSAAKTPAAKTPKKTGSRSG